MNNVYTNSRPTESFCKLKSTCGLHGNLDIHGMEWSERVILKVVAFDRTNGVLVGFEVIHEDEVLFSKYRKQI